MRYPVVLFDVGQTLIGPRRSYAAVYAGVLGELGLPADPQRLDRAIRETAEELSRAVPTGRDRFSHFTGGEGEFWRRFVAGTLGRITAAEPPRPVLDEALARLRNAFRRGRAWKVYDDAVPALLQLRRNGCRLGVVSNWDSRLPDILDTLRLSRYFETIGVSHLERVEKPSPELFVRVLDRMGATPGQTLHVGDVPELDLVGANAAGIDAVLIDREATVARKGVVGSLARIPQIAADGLPLGP